MEEQWNLLKIAPDYDISDQGRLRRRATGRIRFIKGFGQGYHQTSVRVAGRRVSFRIHREVAMAFVPNPQGARTVNHIDCDKNNNAASNLEWVSQKANNAHAVERGLLVKARGERIHTAKLTAEQVTVIKARLATGDMKVAIARHYGVDHATITDIHKGRSWKHV